MNIYAKNGDKVVYLDDHGYEVDREYARKNGFVKGQLYTVAYTNVSGSYTSVRFQGMEGTHNSVMFEDYVQPTEQEPIDQVFNEDENYREPKVVDTVISYDNQKPLSYSLTNSLGEQVTLSKSIDGTNLIVQTHHDRVYVEIELIKKMFGLVDRPYSKIEVIEEKVLWGEPVFYEIDVPAYRALENIWYTRKHSVEITPQNWNDFKHGDVNKFFY